MNRLEWKNVSALFDRASTDIGYYDIGKDPYKELMKLSFCGKFLDKQSTDKEYLKQKAEEHYAEQLRLDSLPFDAHYLIEMGFCEVYDPEIDLTSHVYESTGFRLTLDISLKSAGLQMLNPESDPIKVVMNDTDDLANVMAFIAD